MLTLDNPKTYIKEDRLKRENLVDLIAKSILSVNSADSSICYAIYGQWGEGKSTLLNFVEQELLKTKKEDNINIVHFNPWMLGSEDKLLHDFFKCITTSTPDDRLRDILKKYGKIAAFTSKHIVNAIFPEAGTAIGAFISTATDAVFDTEPSLEEQKKEISKCMAKCGKRLLIIIDDIDRLDSSEIHTLFRLIRQVADFPNTIYLLAMDPHVVAKSLCTYYGNKIEDGFNFIDKIVQVPIHLPRIQKSRIIALLSDTLRQLVDLDKQEKDFTETCDTLSKILTTPRTIVRYGNQLSFVLPILKEQVNLRDLLFLEAIKITNPEAYRSIYSHKKDLLKISNNPYARNQTKDAEEVKERYLKALKDISGCACEEHGEVIYEIIDSLFGETIVNKLDLDIGRRIQSPIYFPVYFIQDVPDGTISAKEITDFKDMIDKSTIKDLAEEMNRILQNYDWDALRRVVLESVHRQDKVCNRVYKLCCAISISEASKGFEKHWVLGQSDIFCQVLIGKYMYTKTLNSRDYVFDSSTAYNTISWIYKNADLDYCLNFNANLVSNFEHRYDLNNVCFTPLTTRFQKLSYAEQFVYDRTLFVGFLWGLYYQDKNGPKEYLRIGLQSKDFRADVLFDRFFSCNGGLQTITEFVTLFRSEELISSFIHTVDELGMSNENEQKLQELAVNYKTTLQNLNIQ